MQDIHFMRYIVFLGLIVLFSIWQRLWPVFKKRQKYKKPYRNHKRVINNILIMASSTLLMRIVFPTGIAAVAYWSQTTGYYFIPLHQLSFAMDIIITVILFDFFIYWQHRWMHLVPFLWRFHKVHHTDHEMDLTTALRFHPLEIGISGLYKSVLLILFSPRAEVFIIYEIILSSMAIFNHANINVYADRWLRYFLVTPQMHFPHHSQNSSLMNQNFGNFLSIWDRLFKSYTSNKIDIFGVKGVSPDSSVSFWKQMKLPLEK